MALSLVIYTGDVMLKYFRCLILDDNLVLHARKHTLAETYCLSKD